MSRRLALIPVVLAASIAAALVVAPPAAMAKPKAPTVTGPALTFATFNVCKGGADGTTAACAAPAPGWSVRRDRVARVIIDLGADVVGLQEATNNAVANAPTQIADIQNLTAPAGFVPPTFDVSNNECRRPRTPDGQLAGPSPCDNTAAILFRSATVEQAASPNGAPSAGIVLQSSIVAGLDADSAIRSVAWAYLRGKNGTPAFLAISLHTSTYKDAPHEASRNAVADALAGWANAMNAAHGFPAATPVVLMSDLNSFALRQPQGAQFHLTSAGWVDSITAPVRTNTNLSSINYDSNSRAVDPQGFPVRPKITKPTKNNKAALATRIDYIMAYGNGVPLAFANYKVYAVLNADGTFNVDYQASDHQPIIATLVFGV